MKKVRTKVINSQWVPIGRLAVPSYYGELYPLPRDRSMLDASFERHGYQPEYPIVVRMTGAVDDKLEVVCGVGRYTVAIKRGMKRVPVILRQFDGDNEARAYAIEDNLYNPATAATISLVHAISLARALQACGGTYSAPRICELARVSESTFWRAMSSLDSTLQKISPKHPEMAELEFSQRVSEIIRRNLEPPFTQLFAGEIEVHTYHQWQHRKTRRSPAVKLRPSTSKQSIPVTSAKPERARKRKRAGKERELPLFEL